MIAYAYENVFGRKRAIHVEEITRFDKNELKCLICEKSLIVKQAENKIKYFSHEDPDSDKNCNFEKINQKAAILSLGSYINSGYDTDIISCKCNPTINVDEYG